MRILGCLPTARAPRLARSMATRDRKGYEAFGSFHSPSTDALFAGHAPPDLPDPRTFLPPLATDDLLRHEEPHAAHNRALFTIDFAHWTYLNHGAFGGPTRYASRVASAWRDFADAQPLRFNDRLLFPYVVQSICALARVLQIADPQELVLLPNATSGLHAVLDSVLRDPVEEAGRSPQGDDVVLCFSTRYGAVRKMLQSIESAPRRARRLRVHEEPLSLQDSYDDSVVLHKLERALDEITNVADGTRCPLVVVDHITSNTGVLLPVEEIVRRCHARGIPVLVDGAHGLFNLPLDLDALGADYYVGNCHKWFASPKGAAFLHVHKRTTTEIRPRVVSHGFYDGFQSAFMWIGLQDYSPWLALPRCIDFWNLQDATRCRTYMHTLVQDATERLYEAWGMDTELADARGFPSHKRHSMRLVKLPSRSVFGVECNVEGKPNDSSDAKHIQDTLHGAHGIEVPVKCVDGELYVRLSAHVYNALSDYDRLGQVIWKA